MQVLARLKQVLRYFRNDVYEELPLRQLETLLFVREAGEVSLSQVAEDLGIGISAAHVAVKALSTSTSRGKGAAKGKGHELLEVQTDPTERRRVIIKLSVRGQRVLDAAESILKGES